LIKINKREIEGERGREREREGERGREREREGERERGKERGSGYLGHNSKWVNQA
jgi:hypothetical protein